MNHHVIQGNDSNQKVKGKDLLSELSLFDDFSDPSAERTKPKTEKENLETTQDRVSQSSSLKFGQFASETLILASKRSYRFFQFILNQLSFFLTYGGGHQNRLN